mgnify:CR=1 FL=1
MLIDLHSAIKKYNMNITGVIHVGGHVGTEYDEYQKIDTIEHMVFFEPDPDHFKKLKSRVSHDKRAICVNKALARSPVKLIFIERLPIKDNLILCLNRIYILIYIRKLFLMKR